MCTVQRKQLLLGLSELILQLFELTVPNNETSPIFLPLFPIAHHFIA